MKKILTFAMCATLASAMWATGCFKKAPEAPATPSTEAPATPSTEAPATPVTEAPAATPEAAKTETSTTTPGAGGLTSQQISDAVSKGICKRMTVCNPQGGSESDCASGLSKDMAGNLSDKAKAVNQGQLDACLASITKATCEQLAAPTPPTGCEFMD